jgi:hypothetical protein
MVLALQQYLCLSHEGEKKHTQGGSFERSLDSKFARDFAKKRGFANKVPKKKTIVYEKVHYLKKCH